MFSTQKGHLDHQDKSKLYVLLKRTGMHTTYHLHVNIIARDGLLI